MSPKKAAAATTSPKSKDSPPKNGKNTPSKNGKDSPAKNGKDSPAKNGKDSPAKNGKGSPTKKEVDADAHTAAMDLFAQGKRHLLVNDIKAAVNSLQEASRMLAEQHGETSKECGDVYFYYGRALLEMARMESDVLGNALDGVPEGEDLENSQVENPDKMSEEEKEKVSEQVDEALQENSKNLEKSSPSKDAKKSSPSKDAKKSSPSKDDKSSPSKDAKKSSPSKDEKVDGKSDKKDEVEDDSAMDTDTDKKDESQDDESAEESQDDESQEDDGEEDLEEVEGEKKEEDDEDVSNHQLAWEMLELAKVIYQKQEEGNKAMSLKTAQVFLKLGEVGLESETYPQSIEDFQSCLKIQEKHMEADDRCLAETHYQLGVAYSFSDDFDKSIGSFSKALKIIEDRITNLKKETSPSKGSKKTPSKSSKKSPSKDAKETSPSKDSANSEIKELNNLIPEIKEKIEDMQEMKKDAKDKINKVKKELGMASAIGGNVESTSNAFGSSSSSSSEAKTIATKKRKPEDEVEDVSKKTKAENGDSQTNGTKNGDHKAETGVKNGHSSPEKMDTDKDKSDATKDLKKKAVVDMEKKTKELKEQSV